MTAHLWYPYFLNLPYRQIKIYRISQSINNFIYFSWIPCYTSFYVLVYFIVFHSFCTRTVLMGFNCCEVYAQIFIIGIFIKIEKYRVIYYFVMPFTEMEIDSFPWIKKFRNISPGALPLAIQRIELNIRQLSLEGQSVLAMGNKFLFCSHCLSDNSYILCVIEVFCIFFYFINSIWVFKYTLINLIRPVPYNVIHSNRV